MSNQPVTAEDSVTQTAPARPAPLWRKALPYLGTLVIFVLIFWRIPMAAVWEALKQAPVLKFVGVFLPFSIIYWLIDSACLTWVINRFNAPLRYIELMRIRASMYLLAMINSSLAGGGVAWYVHRKTKVAFLEILSSMLFIALLEVYQLFLFSTVGVVFYHPATAAQSEIVRVLRIAYVIAWLTLAALITFFAQARRNESIRQWVAQSRFGGIAGTFINARHIDYAIVVGIKAPSFLGSILAQYFALALYGISIPFVRLMIFLPLIFLAAALPISVAHLGTSQAAWLLFFSGSASNAKILAYSLAAHFTFMFCNGLIGLVFVPRASRELTELRVEPA